ncbi:arabinogalactan endo-1,4-beta-galactosidase [Micromonospora sp. RHAY321]|uniref:glycoside hydrolase family 53 protein n=1 Tax=Micromonospora sp. RHAY321 TaxID=2944807 RepID=UPI00207D2502|nr:glycosyl hydrolase 53 family protein [Micromonospora sp. RHAY321]MCO1593920.1 arabinogalactan endo-1,4-beta-galactosidase [Micromonospora sp. RHAY321]
MAPDDPSRLDLTADPNHPRRLSRRTLLAATGAGAGIVPLLAVGNPASAVAADRAPATPAPEIRGADISFTLQTEAAGVRYQRNGRTAPLEQVLRSAGANWVRLRVWVDPPAGYSDLTSALRLAGRARRAGLKVLLDLHYSDFWADPGHQDIPAAWLGQDLATLARTVRAYTADAITAFARQGSPVDMVQVGNEVTAGMLWPVGKIYTDVGERWPEFTTLVKAGLAGARAANPRGHRLRTMLHIDRGGDNAGSRWFYDHVLAQGVEFDVIGQSYYPFWHGSVADLTVNLNDLAARYGKPLVVTETSYPWTMANGDSLENLLTDPTMLPNGTAYPPTPAGQAAYFAALRRVLAGVPGGLGAGFFAWEPGWLPGVGWEPGAGNPNDNLTLFDWNGRSLPALDVAYSSAATRLL